jgi:riboflavin biosynthesis pyrimidine reductase
MTVEQLFPLPSRSLPLNGLYLKHELYRMGRDSRKAFVYADFVTSLDGRIGVPGSVNQELVIPKEILNPRDWRLFHELAVQADVILSTGRYLRQYAQGEAQDIISSLKEPHFADLIDWRIAQGMNPKPALGVISASLDFPLPEEIWENYKEVLVFTGQKTDPVRIRQLQKKNVKVIFPEKNGEFDGGRLVSILSELGYRSVHVTTGPKIFRLLLAASVVDRLYLTIVLRLLGTQNYASIVEGELLVPPFDLKLYELYYDRHAFNGVGQIFSSYDKYLGI